MATNDQVVVSHSYSLNWFLPLEENPPCFCIPVFEDEANSKFMAHVDEYTRKVSSMVPFDLEGVGQRIDTPRSYELPFDQRYIFMFTDGSVVAGTSSEIGQIILGYSQRNVVPSHIAMQIAELFGSKEIQYDARRKMRSSVLSSLGRDAADAYDADIARTMLWDRLIQSAPTRDAATCVLDNRKHISVIVSNGTVEFFVPSAILDECDINIYEELKRSIIEDIWHDEPARPSEKRISPWFFALNPRNVGRANQLIDIVQSKGRQEQRLAALLEALIDDFEVGRAVISQYEERGRFTTRCLQVISTNLTILHSGKDAEMFVADIIPKLFTISYPLRRGQFLLDLADSLGRFQFVNQAIRQKAAASTSAFMHLYRSDIDRMLDHGSARPRVKEPPNLL